MDVEGDREAIEYQGLVAETWDLFRGDTSGWPDRALYLDLIREHGEPVLDVGCGTGRLLLDYLAAGIDVDGVDNAPDMLRLCQAKAEATGVAPTLHCQQMESLELPRRYATILVPSSSFQLLVDPDVARRALARLLAHLRPGGLLAMSFMILAGSEEWSDWWTTEATRPDGSVVRRSTRSRFRNRLEDIEDRYELLVDGSVVREERSQRTPAVRSYSQNDVVRLYTAAGLVDVALLHEFTREPAGKTTRMWTALGTCPLA